MRDLIAALIFGAIAVTLIAPEYAGRQAHDLAVKFQAGWEAR